MLSNRVSAIGVSLMGAFVALVAMVSLNSVASASMPPVTSDSIAAVSAQSKPRGGFIAIPDNGPGTITAAACTSPEGVGDSWCYGSYYATNGTKVCYSNYTHPTKYHSATAKIASATNKVYARAGNTANAWATAGAIATCYAYWNTY